MTYAVTATAFGDDQYVWPSALTVGIVPVAIGLIRLLRQRQVTPSQLIGSIALSWIALFALGLPPVLHAISPGARLGGFDFAVLGPPTASALALAFAWPTLRRWLPRRRRLRRPAVATLGTPRGSWARWLVMLAFVVAGSVFGAATLGQLDSAEIEQSAAATGVCADRSGLEAMSGPFSSATRAVERATSSTIVAAMERHARVATTTSRRVARFRPRTSWGRDVQQRLAAGLLRSARADRDYLGRRIDGARWLKEQERALDRVSSDLATQAC